MYKKWLCSFFIFVTLSHLAGQRIMTYNVLNYQGSISGDSEKEIALRMIIGSTDPDLVVVEEINNRIKQALMHIEKERIIAAPDCGLGLLPLKLVKIKAQ